MIVHHSFLKRKIQHKIKNNPDFNKLKQETIAIIEEYKNLNGLVSYQLIDPLGSEELRESNIQQLVKRGLSPLELSTKKDGKLSQQLIFPWALVSYNNKTTKINLLKNELVSFQLLKQLLL